MWARLENNIVRELVTFDPTGLFHESMVWVACPAGTAQGDHYDGAVFSKPVHPLPAQSDYIAAVQSHLDAAARAKGYDNILSACSYAAVPNLFQAESIAFLEWRSACWQTCYAVLVAVESQLRTQPTISELIVELPAPPMA